MRAANGCRSSASAYPRCPRGMRPWRHPRAALFRRVPSAGLLRMRRRRAVDALVGHEIEADPTVGTGSECADMRAGCRAVLGARDLQEVLAGFFLGHPE